MYFIFFIHSSVDEHPAEKEWGCRYRKQTCGHIGEGESEANRKCIIDIYILPYAK